MSGRRSSATAWIHYSPAGAILRSLPRLFRNPPIDVAGFLLVRSSPEKAGTPGPGSGHRTAPPVHGAHRDRGRSVLRPESGRATAPLRGAAGALISAYEFDGPRRKRPDPRRWRFESGYGWGDGELQYTDRPSNASLDGHHARRSDPRFGRAQRRSVPSCMPRSFDSAARRASESGRCPDRAPSDGQDHPGSQGRCRPMKARITGVFDRSLRGSHLCSRSLEGHSRDADATVPRASVRHSGLVWQAVEKRASTAESRRIRLNSADGAARHELDL